MFIHIVLGVVGLVAFAGGVAAITASVRRWRREQRAALTHTRASGRITYRFLPSGSAEHSEPPRYTIEFKTAEGQDARAETDSVGWTPKKVGDSVEILYNPANPEQAFVRGGERVAAYLLALAGVIFTVLGLLMALSGLDLALS